MKTGVVFWFKEDKGYGFIKPDNENKEVFFHLNELRKINLETILKGTKISFETKEDKSNRIHAFNLKLI
jgi:CspA family cold shock protein